MKNLIDYKYFKGPIALPQMSADYVKTSLDSLITECQKFFLQCIFKDEDKTVSYIENSNLFLITNQNVAPTIQGQVNVFSASNLLYDANHLQLVVRGAQNIFDMTSVSFISDPLKDEVTLDNFVNKSYLTSSRPTNSFLCLRLSKGGQDIGYIKRSYEDEEKTQYVLIDNPQEFGFLSQVVNIDLFDMTIDYSEFEVTEIKISFETYEGNIETTGFHIGEYYVSFASNKLRKWKFEERLKTALANFVYCIYIYEMDVKITQSGAAKGESENSKRTSPVQRHVTRWNINVDYLRDEAHKVFRDVFTYKYIHVNKFNDCNNHYCECGCSHKKNILYNYKNSLGL